MKLDGFSIRGRCHPKGHGGRKERLEGGGERELRHRAQKDIDIAFVDAMCGDERRDRRCGSWGGGNKWVGKWIATTAAFHERLPAN